MTNDTRDGLTGTRQGSSASESVPFEAVPSLASNDDYIAKLARLRELKELKDKLFNDDEKRGDLGEYEQLKRECAAIAAATAGIASITYYDLRVSMVDGGMIKGDVTGLALIETLTVEHGGVTAAQYIAIAKAAKKLDVQALADGGISPLSIVRAKSPDAPRAGSIRVEWVGRKGRGAKSKAKGGAIQ